MSYKVSDWVMALPLEDPTAKFVLLTLAFHVNPKDPQHSCFPSVGTIARETGFSDKTVRNAIGRLVQNGLVQVSGKTNRRRYRLMLAPAAAAPGADVSRETQAAATEATASAPASAATAPASATGHSGTSYRQTSKQHAINREGESPPAIDDAERMRAKTPVRASAQANRYAGASRLPADWQPSPEGIGFAQREHPGLDCRREARSFRDYWLAKPDGVSADWEASWRRWLAQAERFAAKPKGQPWRGKPDTAPPPTMSPDELWALRVDDFRRKQFWLRSWGEPPGSERGCRVPPYILRQAGYAVVAEGQDAPSLKPAAEIVGRAAN